MNNTQNNLCRKDIGLALMCCAIWGSIMPMSKVGYKLLHISAGDTASIMMFAGLRFTIAGIILVIWQSIRHKKLILPRKQDLKDITILGMLQTAIHFMIYYYALAYTIGVRSIVLNSSCSFFVLIFSCLLFNTENMTSLKLLGCIIGMSGIVFMNLGGTADAGPLTFKGEGLLLFAAMLFSMTSILCTIYSKKQDPVTLSAYQMLIGGIVLLITSVFLGGSLKPDAFWNYSTILYIAIGSAINYAIWTTLLSRNEPYRVTAFKLSEPIFGVILSAIMLGESGVIDWPKCIIALAMVCTGIFLANKPGKVH